MSVVEQALSEEGIQTITLNRPDKLNALNSEVLETLEKIFKEAETSNKIKGLLITGAGKAFCAGADINRLDGCNAESGYQFARQGQSVFRLLEIIGKPSLAAINGYAFGGGCEMIMAATFRIASTKAQFGQPEIKLGIMPGYGGSQRLTRLVGKGRALDLCLTGRTIDAETALQWGLVTQITEPDALLDEGHRILNSVIKLAPLAVKSIIEVIDHGFDLSLPDALHLEAVHFAKTCATADKQEGVAAFLAKRPAVFKGV